jgi:hypothetical protein
MSAFDPNRTIQQSTVDVAASSFRTNERCKKAAVIDANFLGNELVEQLVHPQNRLAVLFRFDGQVVHFFRIALQIEKLDVVFPENLLQRLRRVERVGA